MFEGNHPAGEPVGEHDVYVSLAERYQWTPDQINDMDPDYIEDLLSRIRADGDVQREKEAQAERERKAEESKRKLDQKMAGKGGHGRRVESVDI